ncbi:uncharacterized protein LOC115763120 [Drosophila novamexicana]|uniref:uncharacterized protein LOC115763120 n=1 Tax=Drosophila novamexicana TaxID=47314 RepID=UPI0011E5B833|nr:uncharacterized protein LOC115763120 [Drosophila novamexicana]
MSLDKIPEVDMLTVARSAKIHRRTILGFVPPIGLRIVDYGDVDRIDRFYLECQDYRDYYRDPYDKIHKPLRFRQHLGKCGIKLDNSVEELRQPISWVPKRIPPLIPINYKPHMNLGSDMGEVLKGQHAKQSCIAYKR